MLVHSTYGTSEWTDKAHHSDSFLTTRLQINMPGVNVPVFIRFVICHSRHAQKTRERDHSVDKCKWRDLKPSVKLRSLHTYRKNSLYAMNKFDCPQSLSGLGGEEIIFDSTRNEFP